MNVHFVIIMSQRGSRLISQTERKQEAKCNENALAVAFNSFLRGDQPRSQGCLEIRSRNDDANNSTRNRIYSLKVFHSLFLDIYFLFISELA